MITTSVDVFVVDDEPSVARLASLTLELAGLRVRTFQSAMPALAALQEADSVPHVIVLDLSMPSIDGRQFYIEARRLGYDHAILILSAFGAARACEELGADGA